MSEDLIARLKSGEADYFLNVEAADALEALKRENEAMREALRDVDGFYRGDKTYERMGYGTKVRAALYVTSVSNKEAQD